MTDMDFTYVPLEIHCLSARNGRSVLGEVWGERVTNHELTMAEAETVGIAVLRDSALRLYGISERAKEESQ